MIEATSGNTGIALAAISSLRGYGFTAVVSKAVTNERIELLQAYGAKVIFSSAEGGSNEAIRVAHEIHDKSDKYLMLDQYDNPNNPLAHYNGTALEIIKELPDLTTFVAGLGTGGTLTGSGRRLKEHNPDIQPLNGKLQLTILSGIRGFASVHARLGRIRRVGRPPKSNQ